MRADKIVNDLANLTVDEKARLAFLLMWALDGPEQGFLTYNGWIDVLQELNDFMKKNGVHIGGQAMMMEKRT